MKDLRKIAVAADKVRAAAEFKRPAAQAEAALQSVLDDVDAISELLAPYEQIKTDLAEARARYRELTSAFVDELKARCAATAADAKQALVLELFAQDIAAGLDGAVGEKRQMLTRLIERLWDKYRTTLAALHSDRAATDVCLREIFAGLGYA